MEELDPHDGVEDSELGVAQLVASSGSGSGAGTGAGSRAGVSSELGYSEFGTLVMGIQFVQRR